MTIINHKLTKIGMILSFLVTLLFYIDGFRTTYKNFGEINRVVLSGGYYTIMALYITLPIFIVCFILYLLSRKSSPNPQ